MFTMIGTVIWNFYITFLSLVWGQQLQDMVKIICNWHFSVLMVDDFRRMISLKLLLGVRGMRGTVKIEEV